MLIKFLQFTQNKNFLSQVEIKQKCIQMWPGLCKSLYLKLETMLLYLAIIKCTDYLEYSVNNSASLQNALRMPCTRFTPAGSLLSQNSGVTHSLSKEIT